MKGKCVCLDGYVENAGRCDKIPPPCPENSRRINGKCVCLDGYVENSGKCDKIPPCPDNSKRVNGKCVCLRGYNFNARKDECIKCGENEIYTGYNCKCKGGYVRYKDGKCKKIEIPNCKDNQIYDLKTRTCICKKGYQLING